MCAFPNCLMYLMCDMQSGCLRRAQGVPIVLSPARQHCSRADTADTAAKLFSQPCPKGQGRERPAAALLDSAAFGAFADRPVR